MAETGAVTLIQRFGCAREGLRDIENSYLHSRRPTYPP